MSACGNGRDATEGIVHRHGGRRDRHRSRPPGLPAVVLASLLGTQAAANETLVVGRVTGAALLAIGVACALARDDTRSPAQRGVLVGILTYDVLVAFLLVYAGVAVGMAGPALWPAVVLHTVLTIWCILCLRV